MIPRRFRSTGNRLHALLPLPYPGHGKMIETILRRGDFTLTLSLDDESGAFELHCDPPNQGELDEVRRTAHKWITHIGRGRAHRRTGLINAKVRVIDQWHGASCRGFIEQ
jgi:hypothetical protein